MLVSVLLVCGGIPTWGKWICSVLSFPPKSFITRRQAAVSGCKHQAGDCSCWFVHTRQSFRNTQKGTYCQHSHSDHRKDLPVPSPDPHRRLCQFPTSLRPWLLTRQFVSNNTFTLDFESLTACPVVFPTSREMIRYPTNSKFPVVKMDIHKLRSKQSTVKHYLTSGPKATIRLNGQLRSLQE